jgi:glucose/arabinose dehydrogenase
MAQLAIELELFASGFDQPVDIQNAGPNDSRLFIVEQPGKIWIVDSLGNRNNSPFLDISARVNDNGGEQGLLGLAFPLDYASNANFIVHYTDSNGNTQVSLFSASNDPDNADPNSEFQILNTSQPFANHNGGSIAFGPNGYLYIALGDGGSGGDPGDRAQDLSSLLGKILRININTAQPYGIPLDNPFVGAGGNVHEEIWAYGLRNPWKVSFDRLTGDLWIGDVGQNAWEEIDFQDSASAGGINYGWRCYEGSNAFNTSGCPPDSTLTDPAYEYSHNQGGCSVTGGVVYRGSRYHGLYGQYFFSDICTGWIRSLDSAFNMTDYGTFVTSDFFVAFGEDNKGEVFVAGLNDGKISRIVEMPSKIENTSSKEVNIFPNPAEDEIHILFEESDWKYKLKDLKGRILRYGSTKTKEILLDLKGIDQGMYFIKIINEDQIVVKKVIVE